MTPVQLKLKELRQRQSVERGRMSELAVADSLTDETRAELDQLETERPILNASCAPLNRPLKLKNQNSARPGRSMMAATAMATRNLASSASSGAR